MYTSARRRGRALASPRVSSLRVATLVVALSLQGLPAAAATLPCTTICTGSSGACNVSGTKTITPGSTIDCSGRQVSVGSLATIKVEDGDLKLLADTLSVASSGVIKAVKVAGGGSLGIDIETTGAIAVYGNIQVDSSEGGGSIGIDAWGNVTIGNDGDKGLEASGTSGGAAGGDIEVVSGGTIDIQNPVRAESATSGDGMVGGQITLQAALDIKVSTSSGKVFANGYKADAGTIQMTAGRDILLSNGAKLEANGRNTGGNGGGIYLTAANKVDVGAGVTARGGVGVSGGDSSGGSLEIEAGCGGVRIASNLDLRGGEMGGGTDAGSLSIDTHGDLTIESGILIDTHSVGGGGAGGDVYLKSGKKIELKSNVLLDVRGDTGDSNGDGRAGNVTLDGCQITTGAGAKIDARGLEGGIITLDSARDTEQVTSLFIKGTSVFDTTSSSSGMPHGTIRVAVAKESLTGTCSTDPNKPCSLDADCTVGCEPGNCDGLNPDTDNVLTQFVTTPVIIEDENLTGCAQDCAP
jgi:hypothetical protein